MNSHSFLQCGLHDDAVSNFPSAFLWIHQYTQVLFEFCWMHHSHNFSWFCRAWQEQLMFPTSYARSWWFPWFSYPRGRWNRSHAIFAHYSRWSFSSDHFCFSFSLACFPTDFHSSGHWWSGRDVSCFLVNLHPDHMYPSGTFSSNEVNCVKPVQGSDKSREPSMFQ